MLDNPIAPPAARLPYVEFVAMMALLMALNAMAVDVILAALQQMGAALAVADENARQLPLTAYILLFGVSQLFYGPASDRFGRRPVLLFGLAIYALACVGAAFAGSFEFLLLMRAAQGIGAGATRVIAVAVIRDTYAGRTMASVMSLVMMVFMAVPLFAPAIGQGILMIAGWREIFVLMTLFGVAMALWCGARLPETLAAAHRRPLGAGPVMQAFRIVLGNRVAFAYALAGALQFGCIFAFLNSAQQIYQQIYGVGALFPLFFSSGTILIGLASFTNSRLVERVGMRKLSHSALAGFIVLSLLLFTIAAIGHGHMPLWAYFGLTLLAFGLFGFIGTNFNALAMDPLGRVAGTAASVIGFLQTCVGGAIGAAIGQAYDGTLMPLTVGYVVLSLLSFATVAAAERGRIFGRLDAITLAASQRE
jgi:DHA1 family bicyclomycin/chloramphenicol resistance-like MFS transporter